MKLFTQGAAILGLTVVGGLIPSVITYKLDLTYKMGDVTLSVQEMLDKILPALIPLGIVLLSYWLLGKKNEFNTANLCFNFNWHGFRQFTTNVGLGWRFILKNSI